MTMMSSTTRIRTASTILSALLLTSITTIATAERSVCGNNYDSAVSQCGKSCTTNDDCHGWGGQCFSGIVCTPNAGTTPSVGDPATNVCGMDYNDAKDNCEKAVRCPGGSSDECPGDSKCFSGVTCGEDEAAVTEPTTTTTIATVAGVEPNADGVYAGAFCGSFYQNAVDTCGVQCTENLHCGIGKQCFTGITCSKPNPAEAPNNVCGNDYNDAKANCETAKKCPGGGSDECDGEDKCFAAVKCGDAATASDPTVAATTTTPPPFDDPVEPDANGVYAGGFCGRTFDDAGTTCGTQCALNEHCGLGFFCYGSVTCTPPSDADKTHLVCGSDYADAATNCDTNKSCPNGSKEECDGEDICYSGITCGVATTTEATTVATTTAETTTTTAATVTVAVTPEDVNPNIVKIKVCGNTYNEADALCSTNMPCPNGVECAAIGQTCYAGVDCLFTPEPTLLPTPFPTNEPTKNPTKAPTLNPTPFPTYAPTPANHNFCGPKDGYNEAVLSCGSGTACPSGYECPGNQVCYGGIDCPPSSAGGASGHAMNQDGTTTQISGAFGDVAGSVAEGERQQPSNLRPNYEMGSFYTGKMSAGMVEAARALALRLVFGVSVLLLVASI